MWHSPRPGGKPGVDGRSGDYSGEALVLQAIFPLPAVRRGRVGAVLHCVGSGGSDTLRPTGRSHRRGAEEVRLSRRIVIGLALGAVLCAAAGIAFVFGRPAIRIGAGGRAGRGLRGAELLVRFEPEGAVDLATVRVLLNGADVTAECLIASNGVHGELHGLLDGENRLRVEARVRRPGGLERTRRARSSSGSGRLRTSIAADPGARLTGGGPVPGFPAFDNIPAPAAGREKLRNGEQRKDHRHRPRHDELRRRDHGRRGAQGHRQRGGRPHSRRRVVAFTTRARSWSAQSREAPGGHEPESTVYSIKRFMGRRHDEVPRGDQARPVQGRRRRRTADVSVEIDGKQYTPPEISRA